MSIRIQKKLGYGLPDLMVEGGKIVDPRINLSSALLDKNYHDAELKLLKHFESYKRFLKQKSANPLKKHEVEEGLESFVFEVQPLKNMSFSDTVDFIEIYDTEEDIVKETVLLLQPLRYVKDADWSRRDDTIDYIEADLNNMSYESYYHILPTGIFPYDGSYMNKATGERMGREAREWLYSRNHPEIYNETVLNKLAQEAGFKNHEDALSKTVPMLPYDIKNLVEWGELFTEPHYAFELKPMLTVSWS